MVDIFFGGVVPGLRDTPPCPRSGDDFRLRLLRQLHRSSVIDNISGKRATHDISRAGRLLLLEYQLRVSISGSVAPLLHAFVLHSPVCAVVQYHDSSITRSARPCLCPVFSLPATA